MPVIPCPECKGSGRKVIGDEPLYLVVAQVLNEVAQKHGVLVQDIVGPSRNREVYTARREVSRWLRGFGFGLKEIGFYLGKRDHSTIIHELRPERVRQAG